jgi:predicted AAA+ superfamily ATPase
VQYAEEWEIWMKSLYDSRPHLRIVATGSASPTLENGSAESGVGRWTTIRVPTLSFFEYCELLQIEVPIKIEPNIRPTQLHKLPQNDLTTLMAALSVLQQHFNRYLTVGGFPELALSSDDIFAQRMLREDVVDKVIKRDLLALFQVRSPLQLEKVFLYLCMHSSSIFNFTTMSKELENVARPTITSSINFLQKANLIYVSEPIKFNGKGLLKSKPKIYVADAAIRNAVLMLDEVITDPEEMGIMVETTIYKHISAFYYTSHAKVGYYRDYSPSNKEVDVLVDHPLGRILCEVKYRENTSLKASDAIVQLASDPKTKTMGALLITKRAEDFGVVSHNTDTPIIKIPAPAFLYLLGVAEKEGYLAKM